jgi:guanylate kinase
VCLWLLAGTLIKRLMDGQDAAKLAFSVSHTTRKPREGEVDGIHYHFVSKEDFQAGIAGVHIYCCLAHLRMQA